MLRHGLGVSVFAAALIAIGATPVLAHAAERGHVLLLPTGYYLFGGGAAVALTFLMLAVVPVVPLDRLADWRVRLGSIPTMLRFPLSLLCFLFLVMLVAAGHFGSTDPLTNPLPLTVWILLWSGLTLVQGLFGNLWWWINPWYAPWRMLAGLTGRIRQDEELLAGLGYWPALILLAGFAWFELVHPAAVSPPLLANVVTVYFLFNLLACLVFDHAAWTRQGECLSVFFAMIARLAIFEANPSGRPGWQALRLCFPGAKLVNAPLLPISGALFLLLALSTVSFDGLMRTFFWLGMIGVNPLEFPGRTAVMASSTFGMALTFTLLAGAFVLAVAAGERLSGRPAGMARALGCLVWSIIPISMAYDFAHHVTALAVDGQYALAALSDPFRRGWDLLGLTGMPVRAGVTSGAGAAWVIWNLQAGAIIIGHLLAIAVAHIIAWRIYGSARAAVTSQIGLAALMVGYTVFGLWLLAAPTAG